MADNKYGRIFTEEDVKAIVQKAVEDGIESEQELEAIISKYEGKFPKDEPLFLARAQDRYAEGTVRHYAERVSRNANVPQAHQEMALKTSNDFSRWRETRYVDFPD